MIGVNLVLREVVLKDSSDDGSGSVVCVSLGSLQPQIMTLRRGNGCFSLCNEAAGRQELCAGDSVAISVLVLGQTTPGREQTVRCVGDVECVTLPPAELHLSPPPDFLQLPMLVLSHTTLHVPLVQAQGVRTSPGYLTLAICLFDMTRRAIDCLTVHSTGRIALKQQHAREVRRLAQRTVPESVVTGGRVPRRAVEEGEGNIVNDADIGDKGGAEEEEGEEGEEGEERVDDLLRSLEGILTRRSEEDSVDQLLQLSGILRPERQVSDSTLSLDDILAEMAEREKRRKEADADMKSQKEKKSAHPRAPGPPQLPFKKLVKGVLSTQPAKAPRPASRPAKSGAGPGKRAGAPKVLPSSPRNVSRVVVLVRREEVAASTPGSAEGESSVQPLPPSPANDSNVNVSQVDEATERRILERYVRSSQANPVAFPLPPPLVYVNAPPAFHAHKPAVKQKK